MGIKRNTSRSNLNPDDVGDSVAELIKRYLSSSEFYELNELTFTELFAFLFIEIDSVFFKRGIPQRDKISQSLYKKYQTFITIRKSPLEHTEIYYTNTMDSRVSEYKGMLRSDKEKSDVIDRLNFYLDQCTGLKEFHSSNAPVALHGFNKRVGSKIELTGFYTEKVTTYVLNLAKQYSASDNMNATPPVENNKIKDINDGRIKIPKIFVTITILLVMMFLGKYLARIFARLQLDQEMSESFLETNNTPPQPMLTDKFAKCFTDKVSINQVGSVSQYTSEIEGEGIYNIMITHNVIPVKTDSAVNASLSRYLEGRIKVISGDVKVLKNEIVKFGSHTAIDYEYSVVMEGVPLLFKGVYFEVSGYSEAGGYALMDNGYNITVVCIDTAQKIAYQKHTAMREAFLKLKL